MLGLRHPNIVNIMGICSSPAAIVTGKCCSVRSLFAQQPLVAISPAGDTTAGNGACVMASHWH